MKEVPEVLEAQEKNRAYSLKNKIDGIKFKISDLEFRFKKIKCFDNLLMRGVMWRGRLGTF